MRVGLLRAGGAVKQSLSQIKETGLRLRKIVVKRGVGRTPGGQTRIRMVKVFHDRVLLEAVKRTPGLEL